MEIKMKIKFMVTGLDCPNCAAKLAANIGAQEGLHSARINYLTEKLTIETSLSEDDALALCASEGRKFSRDVKITKI